MGQETEYAIRFSPKLRHPGNDRIYGSLTQAIGHHVRCEPGMYSGRPQIFTQNGGGFHYEYLPQRFEGGLIESATPECRGPAQLLLYQRAQEALLLKAIPAAEVNLSAHGFPGKLGLLKNCRDAKGHVYGAQESFEVTAAEGAGLWLYRVALAALVPFLVVTLVASWIATAIALLGIMVGMLAAVVAALPPFRARRWIDYLTANDARASDIALVRVRVAVTYPFIICLSVLMRLFAFTKIRRAATAFFVSRAVFSGAGSVEPDGTFVLSEKAPAVNSVMRRTAGPSDRPIFDTGNLMKIALAADRHFEAVARLFSRKQRLQLGLADSSMLEEAEFLKMGATALVVDMAEAGYLSDAPRLRNPIEALRALVSDPGLDVAVETSRGALTALEMQRYYLDKARTFVKESHTTSLEATEVIELWDEVLTALEKGDMSRLVGRIDWVTKRYLLEACDDDADPGMLKTIDLRYHELGEGYAEKFARTGNVHRLLAPAEIARAMLEPPEGTPAFTRGRFIRSRAPHLTPVRISWESARIGGRLKGRLVRFPESGEPKE